MNKVQRITLVENVSESREVWLSAREGKLGSSDIASIMGLDDYRTPLKTYLHMKKMIDPEGDNDAKWLGRELESTIAKFAAKKLDIEVKPFNKMIGRSDIPWGCATPDYEYFKYDENGVATDFGLLECKNTGFRMGDGWNEGMIPDAYHVQLIWQMGICGYKKGKIVALVGGCNLVDYEIEFDQALFDQIVASGEAFMKRIEDSDPPPPTADDKKVLGKYAVKATKPGEECDLTPLDAALERYVETARGRHLIMQDLKVTTKMLDLQESEIRAAMKDNSLGIGTKYVAYIKKTNRSGYVVKPTIYTTFSVKPKDNDFPESGVIIE